MYQNNLASIKIFRIHYLGKTSKHHVLFVSGNATLSPDINGECKMTAAHSYFPARSTVGTVPILCPYSTIFSG